MEDKLAKKKLRKYLGGEQWVAYMHYDNFKG